MTTKKLILIVVAAVAVMFVASGSFVALSLYFTGIWQHAAEYEEYASEFNVVKDYVLENYPSEEERRLSVYYQKSTGNQVLQDSVTDENAALSEPVQTALNTIARRAFSSDAALYTIQICGQRVDFCTIEGYALVFSPDEKPTWMHKYNDPTNIRVKTIKDGWYHVVSK